MSLMSFKFIVESFTLEMSQFNLLHSSINIFVTHIFLYVLAVTVQFNKQDTFTTTVVTISFLTVKQIKLLFRAETITDC